MGDPIRCELPDRPGELTLPYAPPDPTASLKRRLSRFAGITLLIAATVSLAVLALWLWAWNYAVTQQLRWFTHFSSAHGWMIALPSLIIPISFALLLISRYRRKLFGPETLAAEKAEEKRLLAERISAFGWTIPRSVEAAEWKKVLLGAMFVDVVVFLSLYALGSVGYPSTANSVSANPPPIASHPFRYAFLLSNSVAFAIMIFWVLFVIFPNRIVLLSDGVGQLRTRRIFPYRLIEKVRVTSSAHPKLQCIAILSTDEFGQRWHHFEFSPDAPIRQILATFASKGVPIEISSEAHIVPPTP